MFIAFLLLYSLLPLKHYFIVAIVKANYEHHGRKKYFYAADIN